MKTAEQIAQHIASDHVIDGDVRVSLIVAIREALSVYAEFKVEEYKKDFDGKLRAALRKDQERMAEEYQETRRTIKMLTGVDIEKDERLKGKS